MCGATITSKEMSAGESSSLSPSTFSRLRTGRSAVPRRRTARTVSNKCALPSFQLSTPPHPGAGGGEICSRCGQLNIYVPNSCKMIKWNTFTLNHPPTPGVYIAPPHPLPAARSLPTPRLFATLPAPSLWLVTRGTTQGAQELLQYIDAPLCLHRPFPPHPKVSFPSLLEMAQVNTFCSFGWQSY